MLCTSTQCQARASRAGLVEDLRYRLRERICKLPEKKDEIKTSFLHCPRFQNMRGRQVRPGDTMAPQDGELGGGP